MRMISQLAKNSKKEDNFRMNHSDWKVYKKINKDVGDSDSEEEQERLAKYETILKENDPTFAAGNPENEEISYDSPEWYQLHLATKQIRIPEILFQPSIIGHDLASISETIEFVLKNFSPEIQRDLVNNVFLTGSLANLPGLKERLEVDLMAMHPFKSTFNVFQAKNPLVDSWDGPKKLVEIHLRENDYFITKNDYKEKGQKYFKEHPFSNFYNPTPDAEPVGQP